jgi:hypothetical protein
MRDFASTSPLPPSTMSAPLVSRISRSPVLQPRRTHGALWTKKPLWSDKEWSRFMGTPHRAWKSVCTIGAETREGLPFTADHLDPARTSQAATWRSYTQHDQRRSASHVTITLRLPLTSVAWTDNVPPPQILHMISNLSSGFTDEHGPGVNSSCKLVRLAPYQNPLKSLSPSVAFWNPSGVRY